MSSLFVELNTSTFTPTQHIFFSFFTQCPYLHLCLYIQLKQHKCSNIKSNNISLEVAVLVKLFGVVIVEEVSERSETNMEVVEDDLFFADLSKRISLLIMDDDEDPTLYCHPVSFQVLSQTIHPNQNQIPSFNEQYVRRENKGTGVFIPQSSNNPRRSKQSRSKSSNTRNLQTQSQRHVNTSSGHFPHEPYNNHNTNYTSYNSLNHKRCY